MLSKTKAMTNSKKQSNKEVILDYLKEYPSKSFAAIELESLVPTLSIRQIEVILYQGYQEGRLEVAKSMTRRAYKLGESVYPKKELRPFILNHLKGRSKFVLGRSMRSLLKFKDGGFNHLQLKEELNSLVKEGVIETKKNKNNESVYLLIS